MLFYQNDVFGKSLLQGARKVLKERNITNWVEVPHGRGDVNLAQQIEQIKKASPDTIIFLTLTINVQELIRQIGVEYLAGKKLLGSSEFGEDVFKKFMQDKGLTITNLNVTPNPETSKLEIVEEFRKLAKQANVPIDVFALESYICADIVFYLVNKVKGKITKEKIIKVTETIKDYEHKGLTLNFNPQTQELANSVWIDTGKPEWEEFKG